MKKSFYVLSILIVATVYGYGQSTKVLFIGNSYTGVNNLPQLTFEVALSTGDSLIIDSHTPGGQRLLDHAQSSQAISKIFSNDWNFVVLQAQSQEPSWPIQQVQDDVFKPAKALCDTIRANNNCTMPVFYMTWGRKNGDSFNCPNWPPVCTYNGMDSLLNERYQTMGADNDAFVSPVGAVWHSIRDNYPQIDLYSADESHPSMEGSYAAACTFYTIFLRKDPTFIQFEPGIDPQFAALIRTTVKEVVYDSLIGWNVGKFDPTVDFSFTQSNNQFTVNCTNLSSNATSFLWNFGDGNTSMLENPVHNYSIMGSYEISLEASKCEQTMTKKDTVSFVLGLDELSSFDLSLYPNPVRDILYLKTPSNIQVDRIIIMDAQGKIVLTSGSTTQLNLSNLSSGSYLIQVGTENGDSVKRKIIKE